jgi:hypothetical protein
MYKLQIDPEFQALCPPLTPDEEEQLEANILADGCREPLVVWAGEDRRRVCPRCQATGHEQVLEEQRAAPVANAVWQLNAQVAWTCPRCGYTERQPWTILDGHHRYRICQRHALDFSIAEVSRVSTREEAVNWIIDNQLGRRNLNEAQQAYLRGKRYNLHKRKRADEPIPVQRGPQGKSGDASNLWVTADELADQYGVSPDTIRTDGRFAAALDLMGQHDPKVRAEVLSGQSDLTKSEVIAAGKAVAKVPADQPSLTRPKPDWKTIAAVQQTKSESKRIDFEEETLRFGKELDLYLLAIKRAGGILEMAQACPIKRQRWLIQQMEEKLSRLASHYSELKREWSTPRTIDLAAEESHHDHDLVHS